MQIRDESQAFNLGKQLYPCSSKGFMEVYQDATSEVYGYLVIDCDPKSPWELHGSSSFYLIVCLFYQMDSGWHHNIYVRVHSSTGLSCMYLWCRWHINWVLGVDF